MDQFLIGLASSLVAGVLLVVVLGLLSQQARWILIGLLSRLLDVDIDFVFSNKEKAAPDLKKELKRAKKVDIITSRGNELIRTTFENIFLEKPENRNIHIRILLPKTDVKEGEYDWVNHRERACAVFDPSFGRGLLKKQIEANITFLSNLVESGSVEVRQLNFPHFGRIIVTDNCAYFTPYREDAHGRVCKVYKFRSNGSIYKNLQRQFDLYWNSVP